MGRIANGDGIDGKHLVWFRLNTAANGNLYSPVIDVCWAAGSEDLVVSTIVVLGLKGVAV